MLIACLVCLLCVSLCVCLGERRFQEGGGFEANPPFVEEVGGAVVLLVCLFVCVFVVYLFLVVCL